MRKLTLFLIFTFFSCNIFAADDCKEIYEEFQDHPKSHKEYVNLLCEGRRALNSSEYNRAIEVYDKASKITLFEFPNFQVYPKLACAHCKNGDSNRGLKLLEDFDAMLKIYAGEVRCVDKDGTMNPNVPKGVKNVMCGEIYYSYYENHNAKSLAHIQRMKHELSETRAFCKSVKP